MTELKRLAVSGVAGDGAMLYNAALAGKLTVSWFEPRWWIARGAVAGEALGRGTTHVVRDGERLLVLRHYRRGGFMARLSPDRYRWRGEEATRPFAELRLTQQLFDLGLPVPRPIGARYVREGSRYRGDLLTEFLPGTASLAQRLADGSMNLPAWAAVGRCLRRFHEACVFHADLNAHNVLLRGEEVFVIDFDRGSFREPGLWRDGNLVRLRRSLEKLDARFRTPRLDETQWHCLLAGYGEPP